MSLDARIYDSIMEELNEIQYEILGERHDDHRYVTADLIIDVYNRWEPDLPIKKVYFCDFVYSVE